MSGLVLWLLAGLELDLVLGTRVTFCDLEAALALGIQLVAEKDRQVADPKPDEQGDQPAKRPVGLVIRAKVSDVESKGGRGEDPGNQRHHRAGRHPAEAAQLGVRRSVVEEVDHQYED